MGMHIRPSCHSKAELSISNTEQDLRSQLEESKEKFHELKECFLVSEATVYSMANELKKHNCRKYKDIIESVLGETVQYKEESLTEKLSLADNLRECSFYIRDQDWKLSLFHQKLQQGRHALLLLCQLLKDLLTWDENTTQRQGFHELLAVGFRMAEDLVPMLSAGNHENEESKLEYELLTPRMNNEGAKKDKVEPILQTSLWGDPKSSFQGCDEGNIPETLDDLIDEYEILFSLGETYPEEAGNEDKEAECMAPRDVRKHEDEDNVLQDEMSKKRLAVSQCQRLCDSHQPGKSLASMREMDVDPCDLNVAKNQDNGNKEKEPKSLAFRKLWPMLNNHARMMTLLRKLLQEGRDASLSLGQHLEFLLTQDDPGDCWAQGHMKHLAQGCKMAEDLFLKLSTGSSEQRNHEKEERELHVKMDESDGDFKFLLEEQARELRQLRQKLEEGRDTASTLYQNLSSLLAEDDLHRYRMRSRRRVLAEACRLAKCLAHTLSPDNLHNVDEDNEMTLEASLCEQERNEIGSASLKEKGLLLSCVPDEPKPGECTSIAAFPSQKPEDLSALDGSNYHEDEVSRIKYELQNRRTNPEAENKEQVKIILQASLWGDPKSSPHVCDLCISQENPGDVTDDPELFYSLEETYPQEAEKEDKETENPVPRVLQENEDTYSVPEDKANEDLLTIFHCQYSCNSLPPDKISASLTEEDAAPNNLNVAKNQDNEFHDKEQATLALSVCEEVENEHRPNSLDEKYLLPTCHPGEAEPQEYASSAACPSQKREVHSAVDPSTYIKEACAHGLWNGELTSHFSELQTSQVPLESCIQGIPHVGIPLGQCFEYGDCKTRLSLSTTTWSSAMCTDCGDQCHPFQALKSDAFLGTRNPPKLVGYGFEGSAASTHGFPIHGLCDADSVRKRKTARRKWKIACRFPGIAA